jgi:hypothetical protein
VITPHKKGIFPMIVDMHIFRNKNKPMTHAFALDPEGSLLPDPGSWVKIWSQPLHPDRGHDGPDMKRIAEGFSRDGYFIVTEKCQ